MSTSSTTSDAVRIARRFAGLGTAQRAAFLEKLAQNGVDFAALPIVAVADRAALPLSDGQRGLWLTWQRAPASPAYNLTGLVEIDGALDPDLLQGALDDLAARHETLRTTFLVDADGVPRQRIHPAGRVPLDLHDLPTPEASEARAAAFARLPFDLEHGPLLRVELHRLGPDAQRLVVGLHHIVADGGSVGLLLRDLDALYAARRDRVPDGLPTLAVQFADHAAWQRSWMEAGEAARQAAAWRDALRPDEALDDAPMGLPLDRPRGPVRSDHGGTHGFVIPRETAEALRDLGRRAGATPFMVVLAAFMLTLARHGDTDDVRIGTPLSNRGRPETRPLIGYLTNLAVVRARIDRRGTFGDLVGQVRTAVLEAQGRIDLAFDRVVEAVAPVRRPGVHPLFQVKVTEQRRGHAGLRLAGLPIRVRGLDGGGAHFDLSLDFIDGPDGIEGHLAYTRDLFDPETIADLADSFAALAGHLARAPERPLTELPEPVLPSDTAPRGPAPDVVAAWRARVAEAPDAVALCQGPRRYTRRIVEAASDDLARALAAQGVGPEDRVVLQMGRSPEWVVGLLGVLKAGAAYLPVDPELPEARRADLVADAGARWLVTDSDTGADFGCGRIRLSLDGPALVPDPVAGWAAPPVSSGQAAYLVHTSGSTGRPKGVVVTRGGLAAYVHGVLERLGLPPGARLAMVSTVAADLGNTVLFGALAGGAELHLIDREAAFDPDAFAAYMGTHRIDGLKIVPSHLGALLQAGDPAATLPERVLILGGEAAPWSLAARVAALKPGCRVINHYGPTEATVGALCQDAATALRTGESVPIGTPLARVRAHVLDPVLDPVPVGAIGELYLGGAGLARGYRGQAAATAERFVPDPFGPAGGRLYRTGDRVRRLRDGSLAFVGRRDDQVKIRGHRVEPGEVAAALRGLPGIGDAAVVARPDAEGRMQLAAYVVAGDLITGDLVTRDLADLDLAALKAQAAARLPEAWVPATFTRLDALPLTPNGKLDRRALPEPAPPKRAVAAPQDPMEAALAAIWADLLGLEAAGIDRMAAFTDLGGDSILSLKMLARIRRQGIAGGQTVSLAQILNAPNLAALAARIAPVPAMPDMVHLAEGGGGVPLYCVPGLIANATEFAGLAAALGGRRPVHGFVSHAYTDQRWRGYDVAALGAEYADAIVRTAPGGRCALIGWSSGGDLAFETARRLQGRVAVVFLGLVDVFESVPLVSPRPLMPEARARAAQALDAWIGRSTMAEHWRRLLGLMDAAEREAIETYLLDGAEAPPSDGPGLDAREFELWAMLEKRVRARRHALEPLGVPVHVWQAEHSLGRSEPLRDWSRLAPVAASIAVPGAHHLDIIRHPGFQAAVADVLGHLDLGRLDLEGLDGG
ncbi:amino acid adenylation domain-containing protein [Methylobacterium sp. J-068]|uniref:amino acid adenylation domain-containing protein n=1 Tax=Methylobacterium sp. J-068 TaxID=2836649 RepID=UPI001FBA4D47|nr:amino acid adenylation domain-containing protein [Methylobacterium sp. J-068]MCJ2036124.1 amino acid adenylation domain-containing protein [Methylobacterium sp. J-068]